MIVYQRTGGKIAWEPTRDRWMHELTASQPTTCEPEWVGAEHPLFLLYTSGSTGKPKGVQHSTGGYLLHAALTTKWTFDLKSSDVFWCTADIGWVTGHSYIVYGPLANGATTVIFESTPMYPDPGRYWRIIDDLGVNAGKADAVGLALVGVDLGRQSPDAAGRIQANTSRASLICPRSADAATV